MDQFRKGLWWMGTVVGAVLPKTMLEAIAARLWARDPQAILNTLGPEFNLKPDLDHMPFDLPLDGKLEFQHLAGLFASTALDHGVIALTVRQAAYLFELIRRMRARKVVEIGRYKGGSTFLIAAAMNGAGEFWSIDLGRLEARVRGQASRPYDDQLRNLCARLGLRVHLIVGDSRTVEVDTGEVDLVFIDGDHSYEGVKSDFERFGRRVRLGGAVLFDDAFDERVFKGHLETVGRVVQEILAGDEFRLAKAVDRMAHLERGRLAPTGFGRRGGAVGHGGGSKSE